jgi:uncharacterized membrane protein YsdA (DUF1294 family)
MAFALLIPVWLAIVNALAFLAFGEDKNRAMLGVRRIPERRLLHLAVLGGTLGAYAGRHHYRHKTRKADFSRKLHAIAVVQICLIGGIAGLLIPY